MKKLGDRRALMAELGMPADAPWWRVSFQGTMFGDKCCDYEVEMFGMRVSNIPTPCPWPFWVLSVDGGTYSIVARLCQLSVHKNRCRQAKACSSGAGSRSGSHHLAHQRLPAGTMLPSLL